jgi:cytosine/uracil/thiamine/allantoin permease
VVPLDYVAAEFIIKTLGFGPAEAWLIMWPGMFLAVTALPLAASIGPHRGITALCYPSQA